ncbi:MAG: hypothetical protein RIE52_12020 [Balneola sp.]
MGLNISYRAFDAPYSVFMRFRVELAKRMGIPLRLMEGFYSDSPDYMDNPFAMLERKYPKGNETEMWKIREIKEVLPLKWETLKPNPIHELLYHSDCDGYINFSSVRKMVPELEKLVNKEEQSEFQERLETFISGCKVAIKERSRLDFG